jgi:hypothetical protein
MPAAKPSFPALNRSHPLAQGLAFGAPMYEGSGPMVNDLSGQGLNGSLTGCTWVGAQSGWALSLNGSSDKIAVDALGTLPQGSFSVACLVKYTASAVGLAAVAWGNSGSTNPFAVLGSGATTGSKARFVWRDSALTSTDIQGAVTTNNGQWHMIVGVKNGNAMTLYVDGKQDGTGTASGAAQTLNTLTLGALRRTTTGSFWSGSLDSPAVWSRALSDAEVESLYADSFQMYRRRRVMLVAAGALSVAGVTASGVYSASPGVVSLTVQGLTAAGVRAATAGTPALVVLGVTAAEVMAALAGVPSLAVLGLAAGGVLAAYPGSQSIIVSGVTAAQVMAALPGSVVAPGAFSLDGTVFAARNRPARFAAAYRPSMFAARDRPAAFRVTS